MENVPSTFPTSDGSVDDRQTMAQLMTDSGATTSPPLTADGNGTLSIKDLLPSLPYEAYITESSWSKKTGQCKLYVRRNEGEAMKYPMVTLRAVSADGVATRMKGSDEFLASDMAAVKGHLTATLTYMQGPKGKIPSGLQDLLSAAAHTDEETDDDEDPLIGGNEGGNGVTSSSLPLSSSSSSTSSRKRPRRSSDSTTRDHYVAGPANNTKMPYLLRREQREAGYEKALFGDLLDPRSFLHAAVALPDPKEKAAGIVASVVGVAMEEIKELVLQLKGKLDDADEECEELEGKLADAEAEVEELRLALEEEEARNGELEETATSATASVIAAQRESEKKKSKVMSSRNSLSSSSSSSASALSGRNLTRAVKAVEDQILLSSNGLELNFNLVLKSLLQRPIVRKLFDPAAKASAAAVDTAIVDRLVSAIEILKDKCNNDSERVAYEAVLIAVAPSGDDKFADFVKRLGVRHHTLKARAGQRTLLDEGEATAVWFHKEVAPSAKAFVNKPGCKDDYDAFWENETSVTNVDPSTSSKVTKHSGGRCWHKGDCDDNCIQHVRHYLQVTLQEAWEIFEEKCPGLVEKGCSRTVFFSLVPFWVKKPKDSTCNCIYHTQAQLLIRCYRHVMLEAHKNCTCTCEFCGENGSECGPKLEALNSQAIFEDALCATEESEFGGRHHKFACVDRSCRECGASEGKKFPLSALFACPLASTNDTANFKMIETDEKTSTTTHADGFVEEKTVKFTVKKDKESTRAEFTELLQNHLIEYLPHRHDAHFNAEQFDQMIDGLKDKPNEVIMLMDFGMNYSHVHPDETQGEFWTHVQTTVLPIICYRLIDGEVWAESHVFLSDDLKHDNDFVRHCVGVLVEHLKGDGVTIEAIHFWSDGCGAQFKLKKQFYFISQPEIFLPNGDLFGVRMSHYFFCSCHGKGPSDAETAVTKSKGRVLEGNGNYMAYPIEFYNKVKEKLEGDLTLKGQKQRHTLKHREYYYVSCTDVKRIATQFDGLDGEVSCNHQFKGTGQIGKGKRRRNPCSCSGCFKFDPSTCKQPQFNEEPQPFDISMDAIADTRTLDEMLTERSAKLGRRIKSSPGQGVGSAVALYLDASSDQPQWTLGEVAEAPRHREAGDVIHGYLQRSKSGKDSDMVVKVFKYDRVEDPEGKNRALFEYPSKKKEKCGKWSHECKCDKWHAELEHAVSIRPPFVTKAQVSGRKRDFTTVIIEDKELLMLAPGIAQKIDQCCAEDEAFQQTHSSSYLPTYKIARASSTSTSSST